MENFSLVSTPATQRTYYRLSVRQVNKGIWTHELFEGNIREMIRVKEDQSNRFQIR